MYVRKKTKYGLIGKNINYSFSKKFFNDKFKNENIKGYSYENYDFKFYKGISFYNKR